MLLRYEKEKGMTTDDHTSISQQLFVCFLFTHIQKVLF